MNIRHDIRPDLVQEQLEKKIMALEDTRAKRMIMALERTARYNQDLLDGTAGARWSRAPDTPQDISTWFDDDIIREKAYYSKVRVIELPQEVKHGKRFILVYGDIEDSEVTSGTGPFSTFEDASQWFLKSGR